MYRRFFWSMLMLCCLTANAAAEFEEYPAALIRLHVVAEDDSAEAQSMKLAVRDACLECARQYLADCATPDEAYETLAEHLEDFRAAAEVCCDCDISAEVGIMDFPDRIYGDLKIPAGKYRALKVTLGAGDGHNWWCVLYPTLCGIDEAEYAAHDGEIKFYSILGRWLKSFFAEVFA